MPRYYDGVNDSIDAAFTAFGTNVAMSIACWVNSSGFGAGSINGLVMISRSSNNSNTFGGSNSWFLSWNSANSSVDFIKDMGTTDLRVQTTDFALNIWQFLVLTWDGSQTAANVHIYKGLSGGTVSEVSYALQTDGTGTNTSTNQRFRTGVRGLNIDDWKGYLAHVQYFNRVITIPEMTQIMYWPGSVHNGLNLFWPMQGRSQYIEPDYSRNRVNGFIGTSAPKQAQNFIPGVLIKKQYLQSENQLQRSYPLRRRRRNITQNASTVTQGTARINRFMTMGAT